MLSYMCMYFVSGDIAILVHSGLKAKKALFYNCLAAAVCYGGIIIGILLGENTSANQWVYAAASGMFLYVSLVDMVSQSEASGLANILSPWVCSHTRSTKSPWACRHTRSTRSPWACRHTRSARSPWTCRHTRSASSPWACRHTRPARSPWVCRHTKSARSSWACKHTRLARRHAKSAGSS